jgi:hypothetical protein|tara:strand:- start:143 stop:394 length:252 start_codon:yes stop_codon:yes gene_type:complete
MPRKKGALNHTTRETKEFLKLVVKNEHLRIEEALLELFESNKSSYLNAIVKLLPFITPRATEVHLNAPQMPDKLPSWFDTVEE